MHHDFIVVSSGDKRFILMTKTIEEPKDFSTIINRFSDHCQIVTYSFKISKVVREIWCTLAKLLQFLLKMKLTLLWVLAESLIECNPDLLGDVQADYKAQNFFTKAARDLSLQQLVDHSPWMKSWLMIIFLPDVSPGSVIISVGHLCSPKEIVVLCQSDRHKVPYVECWWVGIFGLRWRTSVGHDRWEEMEN